MLSEIENSSHSLRALDVRPEDIKPPMKDKHSSLFSVRRRSQNLERIINMTPQMTKKLPQIEDQHIQKQQQMIQMVNSPTARNTGSDFFDSHLLKGRFSSRKLNHEPHKHSRADISKDSVAKTYMPYLPRRLQNESHDKIVEFIAHLNKPQEPNLSPVLPDSKLRHTSPIQIMKPREV